MKRDHLLSALGVVAAGVVAVLFNVLVARHYRRWDFTTHGLYTLSSATLETLATLPDNVRMDVLLPTSDPLAGSVKLILTEYQAKARNLDIHYTDPDRRPAEFLALQQKYGIEAGRTEDGQIVMDAAIVLSRPGGKPFFVSAGELLDVEGGQELRARSRMEQALTLALRSLVENDRPLICFTAGHGEAKLDDGGPRGLAELVARLRKNNYEAESVDTSVPNAADALEHCRVAVIVAPAQPFAEPESSRLRAWFEKGGNLFVLAGPVPDGQKGFLPLGLNSITAAAGIVLDENFVFEPDPAKKVPNGLGEQFFVDVKPHEITMGLAGPKNDDLKILVTAARSLSRASEGSVVPADLLTTGTDAFGMSDFFGWVQKGGPPARGPGDRKGSLPLAMASELVRSSDGARPAKGQHGPRMVVVGAATPAQGQSWQERVLRGGAVFTESALAWLAARPTLVDIPDKPAVAGLRITEGSLGEVSRYVLLYMPAAAALLGLAIYLRRKSTEGHPNSASDRSKE